MKSPRDWFYEIKQCEKSPVEISEIDNLLQQDSLFDSSNGAKLLEYITKKKRGEGGRVRLHDIFQRVQMQRPQFNYDMDTSDPTPLPPSPAGVSTPTPASAAQNADIVPNSQIETSGPTVVPVIQNGQRKSVTFSPKGSLALKRVNGTSQVPMVLVNDLSMSKNMPHSSAALGRQVLINQYQRTNAAKCELLRQLAASTPKPDTLGSSSRFSVFTTSISPITEGTPDTPNREKIPSKKTAPAPVPVTVETVAQEVLAPCSQPAVSGMNSPRKKVVVESVPTVPKQMSPEVVIPETPSPVKEIYASPKAPQGTQVKPRRLSTTFRQLESAHDIAMEAAASMNGQITSDESGEPELAKSPPVQSILRKTILKDTSLSASRDRQFLRVSFSQQLVQEREISPAPSIPEAHYSGSDGSNTDDSDSSESYIDGDEYEVVDEVYSDEDFEEVEDVSPVDVDAHVEYSRVLQQVDRSVRRSPLIHVDDQAPIHLFESMTPARQLPDEYPLQKQEIPPSTVVKNKTDMQLVDIITDWDDEEDDEGESEEHHSEKPPDEVTAVETRQSNNHQNETNLDTMDISSSNLEDSNERIIELPPPPETPINVEKPPPRPISPPAQFNDSAKHRFLRANEEELINRIQNDLPISQPGDQISPTDSEPYEKVSETLVEIAQSFRDQPQSQPASVPEATRKVIAPTRKSRSQVAPIDPTTASYMETIEKTFAKPGRPSTKKSSKSVVSQQKRKLYSVAESTDQSVVETCPEQDIAGISPGRAIAETSPEQEQPCKLRELRVVLEKLQVEDYNGLNQIQNEEKKRRRGRPKGSKKKQIVVQPEEPDSEGQPNSGVGNSVGSKPAKDSETVSSKLTKDSETDSAKLAKDSETDSSKLAKESGLDSSKLTKDSETDSSKLAKDSETDSSKLTKDSETDSSKLAKDSEIEQPRAADSDDEFAGFDQDELQDVSITHCDDLLQVVVAAKRPIGRPRKIKKPTNDSEAATPKQKPEPQQMIKPTKPSTKSTSISNSASTKALPFKKRKSFEDNQRSNTEPVTSLNSSSVEQELPNAIVVLEPLDTSLHVQLFNAKTPQPKRTGKKRRNGLLKEDLITPSKIRYYPDNEGDITWKPLVSKIKKQRRRQQNDDSGIEEEDMVRRSCRSRRTANYRPMTLDQVLEADRLARRTKAKAKAQSRKRIQDPDVVSAEQGYAAKKQRTIDNTQESSASSVAAIAGSVVSNDAQEPSTSSGSATTNACSSVPKDAQEPSTSSSMATSVSSIVSEDAQKFRDKVDALSWLRLLSSGKAPDTEAEGQLPDRQQEFMHFTLEHLQYKEHEGIRYSFYAYSDTENIGFLRFAPNAEKRLTKTKKFQLKFLIVQGTLNFQINDITTIAKTGDFLMLPHGTKFLIRNGNEEALMFMLKYTST